MVINLSVTKFLNSLNSLNASLLKITLPFGGCSSLSVSFFPPSGKTQSYRIYSFSSKNENVSHAICFHTPLDTHGLRPSLNRSRNRAIPFHIPLPSAKNCDTISACPPSFAWAGRDLGGQYITRAQLAIQRVALHGQRDTFIGPTIPLL